MKKSLAKIIGLLVVVGSLAVTGCSSQPASKEAAKPAANTPAPTAAPAADDKTLTAIKTTTAPTLDGKSSESFWATAPELKVSLAGAATLQGGTGGKFDNGKTDVTMKASYDAENLYVLLQYKDPTESQQRGPWKLEGGKLVKQGYRAGAGWYEDKFGINWNINDSVKDFNTVGCSVTCHATADKDGKALNKHWTNAASEMLDTWHWKSVRQNTLFGPDKPGLMHDQFMDNVNYNPADAAKTDSAGRHSDPGDKEYADNVNDDKSAPKLVLDGAALNGDPFVIVNGLDKTKPYTADYLKTMKEGDFIPGLIAKQITGDPADIKVKGKWENGVWTLEIARKLKTTSDKDIQFADLAKTYYFALAAFDNSQIGHAYQNGAQKLVFKQ